MHSENWDDLRFVLAVAEAGTVSGAARALGVNHATVLRRVAAFEAHHGVAVFERGPNGYAVPRGRARVIQAAREAAAGHLAVARLLAGARAPLSGAVRVTSTDTFCVAVLPVIIAGILGDAPKLRIDVLSSNAHADLGRLEADIAVRPAARLPDDLIGEEAARLGFAVYAPVRDPANRVWLGLSGTLSRVVVAAWLAETQPGEPVAGGGDSFVTLREMVATGQGRAVLPCILGDGDPRLVRREADMPPFSVPIWVASHADLADSPRLAAVRSRLVAGLRGMADRLRGR